MEINALVDEQEPVVLAIASGKMEREILAEWLQQNTIPHPRLD
jgi:death-on-curing protein